MRQFVLIAAMVLASATAHAESRSLSLAGSNVPVVAEPPKAVAEQPRILELKAVEQKAAEAPVYVERPAVVEPKTVQPKAAEQPKAETAKAEQPVATKTVSAPKAGKPKRKRYWTEARIIGELHRHGIYW